MEQLQLIAGTTVFDTDAMAAHIAAHARSVPFEDRISSAAEDQGFGQVTLPARTEVPRPPKRTPRPFRGKLRGESETEITPAGHEPYEPLDEATRTVGRLGLAAARRTLSGE